MSHAYNILFFISCSYLCACVNNNYPTPKEYRYIDTTSSAVRQEFSRLFADSMKIYVRTNKEPFHNKIYDTTTSVLIDTVILSPEKGKSIFFVITDNSKNPSDTANGKKNHYDAFCFLAKLDNGVWRFINMGPFFYDNYDTKEAISKSIRHAYFCELSGRKYIGEHNYNLDDKRYWDEPVWSHFIKN